MMTPILIALAVFFISAPTIMIYLIRRDGGMSPDTGFYICCEDNAENPFVGPNVTTIGGKPCVMLKTGKTVFGRRPYADVEINDKYISKKHFSIEIKDGTAYVEDLRSTNGTYVSGKRIEMQQELFSGNVIQIGLTKLKFLNNDASESKVFP